MQLLLAVLAIVPTLECTIRDIPPICIPEVSTCSEGLIQGKGIDGTYCYDDKYNIKEKVERSGKYFEEVTECAPGLKQGKSVLISFCVDDQNIPRQKLTAAFDQMAKVEECARGLRQGSGAYKRFCFDDENNIVQLLHGVEDEEQ